MGKFNQKDRFGGKQRFDNDRGFGGGDRSEKRQMHQAVCSECGKNCEVPFRPTGDKPVFCSDCFGKKDGGNNKRFDSRSSGRQSFGDKQMFRAICDKCHRECEVPFRPTGDKPVFCSDCFGKGDKRESGGSTASHDQYRKQFEMLNNKLDNILKLLSPNASGETLSKTEKPASKAKETIVEKKISATKGKTAKKEVKKTVAKKIVALKTAKKTAPKKAAKKKK